MLVPIDEEVETGQLVDLVRVAEPWPAAFVVAHFSVLLVFLDIPFCFCHPDPIHCAAAAEILCAAAAGIGTGGVGFLQV